MNFTDIVYEVRGRGAWIRLNRPDALNTLSPNLVDEMDAALDAAQADPNIVALVITGAGRAFCAGADLKFLGDLPEADRARGTAVFLEKTLQMMLRIEKFSKPVIGAINGISTGGGTELMLCFDLVVA